MKNKYLNEKNALIIIIILIFAILLTPITLKGYSIHEGESYFHMRIVEQLSESKKLTYDSLMDRPITPESYYILLFLLDEFIDLEQIIVFVPIVFSFISLILFYFILKQYNINLEERFFTLVFLILSPTVIFMSNVSNKFIVGIFFLLLGHLLLLKKQKIFPMILLGISLTFGWFNALLTLIIIAFYVKKNKASKRFFYPVFSIFFIVSLIYYIYIYSNFGMAYQYIKQNLLSVLITEFGAEIGFGFFFWILSLVGIILLWKKIGKFLAIPLIVLIIISPYFNFINLYLGFIYSYFAAHCFLFFWKREWFIKLIKNLTLLILFCGIIFATFSHIQQNVDPISFQDNIEGLQWLKYNTQENSIIISDYEEGFLIGYFAEREAFMDYYSTTKSDFNTKHDKTQKIFASRNLKETSKLLDEESINYIFINQEMKKDIWKGRREGLLFLFRNTKKFKNVYNKNNIEIWEVLIKENGKF